jgi:hypothetical protein
MVGRSDAGFGRLLPLFASSLFAWASCKKDFSRCAPGDHGQCKMPSSFGCAIATPYCESPLCVVSYTTSCYEGCVLATECAP